MEFMATSEARHLPPDLSFSSRGAPKLIGTLKSNLTISRSEPHRKLNPPGSEVRKLMIIESYLKSAE